jgi:adenine-specific DNA-methyltransferase
MPTLNWIGKDKVIKHHHDVPFRVLEKQYDFGLIDSNDKNEIENQLNQKNQGSDNLLIHGDNLEALKALLPYYEGKIKCIYIDPPYNTGNEGWVYNDNVNDPKIKRWLGKVVGKEAEDLTRHDKWLCMMYPRLKLLHKLLAPDGAIFVSIDDNEQANLKLLMDEIWGVGNFVTQIVWQSRQSLQNDTDISINHEYLLVYGKKRRQKDRRLKPKNASEWFNIKEFAFFPIPIDESKFSNPDNDPRGKWKADPFDAPNIRENLTYPITNPNTQETYYPPTGRCWRTEPDKYQALFDDKRILFGKNGKSKPQLKIFYEDVLEFGSISNTWFTGEMNGTATHGTKEIQKIFGQKIFDTPKPTTLLENIFSVATDKNALILDSFAGSGTTAHAVLNLNKADGGNRKFILIEMEDYAETITAERIKRVINGYAEKEGTGGDFAYYELGEAFFDENRNLNEHLSTSQIEEYIYYSETKQNLIRSENYKEMPFFLEKYQETAYFFIYEKDKLTTLDYDFLGTVQIKAEQYVMYADNCTLPPEFCRAKNIIFKKIPRDISRF